MEIVTDICTAHRTHNHFAKVLCRRENLAYQNFKSLPTRIPEGKTSKTFNYIPPMSQEKEKTNVQSLAVRGESFPFAIFYQSSAHIVIKC